MNEESDGGLVHVLALGKGSGFSDESPTSLSERTIESLNMVGMGFGFILSELPGFNHFGVSFPNIRKTVSGFVRVWNRLPKLLAGWFATTANDKGHDLPSSSAQSQPYPAFIFALFDETPDLIQF